MIFLRRLWSREPDAGAQAAPSPTPPRTDLLFSPSPDMPPYDPELVSLIEVASADGPRAYVDLGEGDGHGGWRRVVVRLPPADDTPPEAMLQVRLSVVDDPATVRAHADDVIAAAASDVPADIAATLRNSARVLRFDIDDEVLGDDDMVTIVDKLEHWLLEDLAGLLVITDDGIYRDRFNQVVDLCEEPR